VEGSPLVSLLVHGGFVVLCLWVVWLGWPCLRIKLYRRPGTEGSAFIYFLPSGVRSTQKVPGAPARSQASFPIALKLFTKTLLIGSINRM
jgi:hypothetical protein